MGLDIVGSLNRIAGTNGLEAGGAANAAVTRIDEIEGRITQLEFDVGQGGGGSHPDLTAHVLMGLAATTDLTSALATKADVVHNHDGRYYTETETDTLLSGKANVSHSHLIADVANLQTTLDAKAAATHNHDSTYAAVNHNHDSTYVNESDHTKAAHDALGIDAATLDGIDSTGFATAGHTHGQLHDRQHSVISTSDHTFPGGTTNFLRADGTWAAPPSGSGGGVAFREFTYLADGAGITKTNIPTTDTEVGTIANRKKIDLTGFTDCRIQAGINKVGTGTQTWTFQYSLDNSAWTDLVFVSDAGGAGEHMLTGGWGTLPAAAKADVYIRMVGRSTVNTDDPIVRAAHLQVR